MSISLSDNGRVDLTLSSYISVDDIFFFPFPSLVSPPQNCRSTSWKVRNILPIDRGYKSDGKGGIISFFPPPSLICVHDVLMSGSGKSKMFQKKKKIWKEQKYIKKKRCIHSLFGQSRIYKYRRPSKVVCVYTIDPIYVRTYVCYVYTTWRGWGIYI
jgi:hypothetical protein